MTESESEREKERERETKMGLGIMNGERKAGKLGNKGLHVKLQNQGAGRKDPFFEDLRALFCSPDQ